MRSIYLVRHGLPDFPGGMRVCLGHTDFGLSAVGRMQALLAASFLAELDVSAVFCSRLLRAVQTAEPLGDAKITDGLEEMHFGEWDGLSFKEISERWPELYAARGLDMSIQPAGAESFGHARARFSSALRGILERSTGNVAVVSHASVMQAFLSDVAGKDLPPGRELFPYGSISELRLEGDGFSIEYTGAVPRPPLSEALCLKLLAAAGTPEHIIRHSRAVSEEALRIGKALSENGINLNMNLIFSGALLHDIARTEKEHWKVGADWLKTLGYPCEAEVVGAHNSDSVFQLPDEAAVLAAADRVISEDELVGLHEKFRRSAARCRSEEAKEAHARRYRAAQENAKTINRLCGREIIKL